MGSKFFHRFIAVTLLFALLLVSGSRAIRVSALAEEVAPAIAPVFDTTIYQLQDYIDNGGMTDPQLEIFYVLAGVYTMAQAGSQNITLNDTFQYDSGVIAWLKSMGIKAYNSLITLAPDSVQNPITGEIMSTIPLKNACTLYVADLMGMAIEARSFNNLQEFLDEVDNDSFYISWSRDLQNGINSVLSYYDGIYQWQFDTAPFTTDETWNTVTLSGAQLSTYMSYLDQMDYPTVRANRSTGEKYCRFGEAEIFDVYYNIFINTSNNTINVVNADGNKIPSRPYSDFLYTSSNGNVSFYANYTQIGNYMLQYDVHYNSASYNTILDLVHAIYNNDISITNNNNTYLFLEDWIRHVYYGIDWAHKTEVFNTTDFYFNQPALPNDLDYYLTFPDYKQYFIDLHDLITDLVGISNLFQVIINHIVDENGVQVHDDQLIRITTSIQHILDNNNPLLPVNLNDIADYTDNSYLDRVKEEGRRAGNALSALVAFWHNVDAELIYVLFGASITILVGAFIGKWGHS